MKARMIVLFLLMFAFGSYATWNETSEFYQSVSNAYDSGCLLQSDEFQTNLWQFLAQELPEKEKLDAQVVLSLSLIENYETNSCSKAVAIWENALTNFLDHPVASTASWQPCFMGVLYVSWQAEFEDAERGYTLGMNLLNNINLFVNEPEGIVYELAKKQANVRDLTLVESADFAVACAAKAVHEFSVASNLVETLPESYKVFLWEKE